MQIENPQLVIDDPNQCIDEMKADMFSMGIVLFQSYFLRSPWYSGKLPSKTDDMF